MSKKVEGRYTVVAPYPNAVEGYSINELGAIANTTIAQIIQILRDGEKFDSPCAFKARFYPIVDVNFNGIPHTLQKQIVLETIESIMNRHLDERKKNREKVTGDSISKIK